MRSRSPVYLLLALPMLCLAAFLVYNLPSVHDRLGWRVENLVTQVRHRINPPAQAVFVPQAQVDAAVNATLAALPPTASATMLPSPTPTVPGPTDTPQPTATATPLPTPIPEKVILTGAVHEYQQMNNCGPATLAMALSYWGWQGDQRDTRLALRPNFKDYDDKNVMPAEMARFVEENTGLKAQVRVAGDLDLLKRLVAAGFPVIIEKGFQPPKEQWMGHFELVTGYDDTRQRFITQDSYIGAEFPVPYPDLQDRWWRDFNYVYVVIYPPEREAEVMAVLGSHADPAYNLRYAADVAQQETGALAGRDLFFAWYNLGTNLLALQDYAGAASAYDQAFQVYPAISENDRPWRMLWYQVGPYEAYYQVGRYQDVINLGLQTNQFVGKPVLEETYYWLGKAREALGDLEKAIQDYQRAAAINPGSTLALQELQRLGVQAPSQ